MNQIIDYFRENKKDLIGLIFIILLIIAIPLSFILVKQTQIFKSRASSNVFQVIQTQEAEIKYENSSKIETTSPSIDIELTSPIDNEGKQSDSGWIKTAYAAGPPRNIEPASGATINLVNPSDKITFKWDGGDYQNKHNLIIYEGTNSIGGLSLEQVSKCEVNGQKLTFCKTGISDKTFDVSKDYFKQGTQQYTWFFQGVDHLNRIHGSQGTIFTVNNSSNQVENKKPVKDAKPSIPANQSLEFSWNGIKDITKYRLLIAYTDPAKNSGKDSENNKYDVCKADKFDPPGWDGYYLCKEVDGVTTEIPVARLTDKTEYNWWVDPIGADGKKKGDQSDGTKFTLTITPGPTPTATPKATATATPIVSPNTPGAPADTTAPRGATPAAPAAPGVPADRGAPPQSPGAKKPQDDPKYCAGYYQRCGDNLEGTQWCEGGYKLTNGACGWDDGHPTYVSGCYKTREDVARGTNKNGCNITASPAAPQSGGVPNQPAGRDGPAPVSTIDYKSPGSLHGDKVVTLCGKDLTLDQLREELRGAGYNGLYDEPSATAAYLKTACPKSQNNCNPFPDTGDTPEGYIWVADCSAAGECLRNNSTGNDKNLCIDPKQGDPAACPKNYNDPYVNPATSNWCFGFANGNKCLMLWSKNYNENRKDVVAKGGGTPNPAMCPTGTTATPARPTASPATSAPVATPRATGNVGIGTTVPQNPGNVGIGLTNPPTSASNRWLKASCTSNVFAGCTLPGGKVCSDWGANSEAYKAAGWSEDEYKKCQSACRVYEDGKNSPAACLALGVQSPSANNKTLSGRVQKQVKEGNSCVLKPMSGWVVSVYQGGVERQDIATDEDGRYSLQIPEDKLYAVRILNDDYYQNEKKETIAYKWDKRGYENQKQGSREDCGSNCNFVRLEDGCTQVGPQGRLSEGPLTSEYRVSQDRVAFNDPEALWQTYTQGGVRVRQVFNNPGQHFVFVQFRDSDKKIISPTGGDGIYILTVNYKPKTADPAAGGAALPTQQPSAQPTAPGTPCTTPSQPSGLTYDPSSKTISWNPVSGVSEYHLRVVTPHKGQRNFDGIKNTWYTMPSEDVSASGGYSWWIDAVNSCGTGRSSSSFTVGGTPPAGGGGWVCSANDYGDYASGQVTKEQWCNCAAQNNDNGSLQNGPGNGAGACSQAKKEPASCNDRSAFPLKETCGNMTYSGRCDADVVCSQSGATADTLFTCIGDDSYRCTGQYRCGSCARGN